MINFGDLTPYLTYVPGGYKEMSSIFADQ
jgi:hypothetical protein